VARVVAHVFVADLDRPELAEDDGHHLDRVLRLRPGEVVSASDGRGGLRLCTYVGAGGVEPAGEAAWEEAPAPPLAVGFALIKGDRPEWIVQKLTECGVDRIVPFVGERSVVQWEAAKAERQAERMARVAREAAMQSRRRWLPVVEAVAPFASVVAEANGSGWVRADLGADEAPTLDRPSILVGPEGGWSEAERVAVAAAVGLGPTVLRAETAAVAAGVLLSALRSGVVAPSLSRAPRSSRGISSP
jgi:16S rRNA (uracil1498-N3)-methyltransferase